MAIVTLFPLLFIIAANKFAILYLVYFRALLFMSDNDVGKIKELVKLSYRGGWYNYSYTREGIIGTMEKIINNGNAREPLVSEAIKTRNRLAAGCNVPFTP